MVWIILVWCLLGMGILVFSSKRTNKIWQELEVGVYILMYIVCRLYAISYTTLSLINTSWKSFYMSHLLCFWRTITFNEHNEFYTTLENIFHSILLCSDWLHRNGSLFSSNVPFLSYPPAFAWLFIPMCFKVILPNIDLTLQGKRSRSWKSCLMLRFRGITMQ